MREEDITPAQKEVLNQCLNEVFDETLKDCTFPEKVMVTMASIAALETIRGLDLRLRIKVIDILSQYLHTAEGLLK